VIDSRREANHIWKEFGRFQHQVGENVVWFCFDTANSQYDDVYDEGGRKYKPGLNVAVLWIDQVEGTEQYTPEGKRPSQSLRFAVAARMLYESGISDREAHGHRVWDAGLINETWFEDRLNDVVYYDGRYYEVVNFQIRGRIREDVIIGVTGTETYPEDDTVFDYTPASTLPDFYAPPEVP